MIFQPCMESMSIAQATLDQVRDARGRLVFSFAASLMAKPELPEPVTTGEAVLLGAELVDACLSWASGNAPPALTAVDLGLADLLSAGFEDTLLKAFETALQQAIDVPPAPLVRNAWRDILKGAISKLADR